MQPPVPLPEEPTPEPGSREWWFSPRTARSRPPAGRRSGRRSGRAAQPHAPHRVAAQGRRRDQGDRREARRGPADGYSLAQRGRIRVACSQRLPAEPQPALRLRQRQRTLRSRLQPRGAADHSQDVERASALRRRARQRRLHPVREPKTWSRCSSKASRRPNHSGTLEEEPTTCGPTGLGSRATSRGSSAGRTRRAAKSTGARSRTTTSRACTDRTPSSRIADPADPARVFSWLLDLSFDDRGNAISYLYKAEDDAGVAVAANEVEPHRQRQPLPQARVATATRSVPPRGHAPRTADEWCFELVLDYGEHDLETPTPEETRAWSLPRGPVLELPLGL